MTAYWSTVYYKQILKIWFELVKEFQRYIDIGMVSPVYQCSFQGSNIQDTAQVNVTWTGQNKPG